MTGRLLGEILVQEFGLAPEEVEAALSRQGEEGRRIGEILQTVGKISPRELARALARQFGYPFLEPEVDEEKIDLQLLERVPVSYAKNHLVLPLWRNDSGEVVVAIADPTDYVALDDLSTLMDAPLAPSVMEPDPLMELINKAYARTAHSVELGEEEGAFDETEMVDLVDLIDMEDEAPIIRWVNAVLFNAAKERASDIHIEPGEKEVIVRYRIDGRLYQVNRANKNYLNSIVARIKIMAGLDIAEKRLPQDGRIRRRIAGRDIDMRVATIPTARGERITIRLLDQSSVLLTMEQLGMGPDHLNAMEELIHRPHGIILVTGPTGSGKTTTLYAALSKINTPDKNILTIEDPVEYQLPGISQVQVNPKINLTFATGLRSFLRHDPDVIMVGEIRDLETAEIAIQASLTGHLVLSTVHTNDAASAITRLVDMGVEPFLVASSLTGILAQRLVRKLCPVCKEPYVPTREELEEVGIDPDEFFEGRAERHPVPEGEQPPPPGHLYRAKGCKACMYTGYQGRIGIYELLLMDDDIRSLSIKKVDAAQIKKLALSKGMRTLRQDGARKVLAGITSIEEVMRVTAEDTE